MYLLVWFFWLPKGKDILYVSSESPVWGQYMASEILPLVSDRAIALNWSERAKWSNWSFRVRVFKCFAGYRNFNPVVIVFRPLRRAKVFRFYEAFRDWKHGRTFGIERLRQDLSAYI